MGGLLLLGRKTATCRCRRPRRSQPRPPCVLSCSIPRQVCSSRTISVPNTFPNIFMQPYERIIDADADGSHGVELVSSPASLDPLHASEVAASIAAAPEVASFHITLVFLDNPSVLVRLKCFGGISAASCLILHPRRCTSLSSFPVPRPSRLDTGRSSEPPRVPPAVRRRGAHD